MLTLVFAAAVSQALSMEYVSPEQKQQLVDDFEKAKLEKAEAVAGKAWTCDMYGVRSRLQVQRDVKLYSLKRDASGVFKNSGAQPVADYQPKDGALLGVSGRFEDQVRLTTDGQLISKLSVLQPERMVVAYSVCRVL